MEHFKFDYHCIGEHPPKVKIYPGRQLFRQLTITLFTILLLSLRIPGRLVNDIGITSVTHLRIFRTAFKTVYKLASNGGTTPQQTFNRFILPSKPVIDLPKILSSLWCTFVVVYSFIYRVFLYCFHFLPYIILFC